MKYKSISILITLIIFSGFLYAQDNVGIGTLVPNQSSILELKSNNKGLLITRVSTSERNAIVSPATGLLVYDTDFNQFWYFDGTQWVQAIGLQGPQGPQGLQGLQGVAGTQGPSGIGITSTINNGNGTYTFNYSDGSSFTTANLTGPQGVQGTQGLQGIQGAAGTQGAAGVGITSTVNNGNGTYTFNYSNGSSFTTANLTGPQGAQGIQGPQGVQGLQGLAGSGSGSIYLTWVSGSLSPGSATLTRFLYCADPANNASNWAGVSVMTPEDNAAAAGTAIGSDNLWYCPMSGTVNKMWVSINSNSSASPANTTYTFDLFNNTTSTSTGVNITITHTGNSQPIFGTYSGSVALTAGDVYTLRSVHSAAELSGVLSNCKVIVAFTPN